ncbi:hypothetical protein FQN53_004767 [Emmonsiellopsis sp. PD_33]|nr:hypothetical protein FQN53_004767 [Emmonsiellopsis sp. PD_33]
MIRTTNPPRIVSEKMNTKDITAAFTKASSTLNTGQLVKDEYFTLFEAVGALEIMDSKMDSGYLAPGETLDDDYDVMRALLPEELVGIMDQLLCYEAAWHMGHPLSQTLFTSIYLDRLLWPVPRTLDEARFDRGQNQKGQTGNNHHSGGSGEEGCKEDNWEPLVTVVLRAYCLALIKACDRVNAKVGSEYFHEEEDFVTQLYNRSLLSDVDSAHIQGVLNEALSWLAEQKGVLDDAVREALVHRLAFRRELLSGLDMDTMPVKKRSTAPFDASLSELSLVEKSMSLGKPVPEAFSLKIQRRLASTVPPRPMVNISPEDAVAHLNRFCRDAADVQDLLVYRGPQNLEKLVWALQSRKPQPSVYIRSLVQSLLVNDMEILGSVSVKEFFFDELAELVLPSSRLLDPKNEEVELPSDSRFQIAKHMDNFVKRAAQPFVDTYRTACLNRSRVRRTLCHTVVDWDALQAEAEDFDVHLRTLTLEPSIILHGNEPTYGYPLSSWAYHQKLRQLRLILQLGFELSIYSPEELPGMYWYLSHLCSTHLAHLDRIRSCVLAARKRTTTQSKTPDPECNQAYTRTLSLLDRLTTELIAIDAFAIALHALYVLFARYNLLPSSSPASPQRYSSDPLRYELRMKPFLPISLPELIPFETFEHEATLAGDNDALVLDRALRAIAEAKKGMEKCLAAGAFLETAGKGKGKGKGDADGSAGKSPIEEDWARDVKDSLRACIGASIAIGVVKKAIPSAVAERKWDQEGRPGLNLAVEIPPVGGKGRWHDWWAVPKVTEVVAVR